MATQSNSKVFVSPGVYTSETDLSFVAQSVGVTTLGLVGESLKGPAFEPIFITNYDEFQAFFGGTEPTKFVNTQIPKYEAAYIAKAYLQQSNQLFFTRILGLSGYDAGPSWSIRIKANVDTETIGLNPTSGTPFTVNFTGTTTGTSINFSPTLPGEVVNKYTTEYTLADGSTSTFEDDFVTYLDLIFENNSLSATTSVVYGAIPDADYNTFVAPFTNEQNVFGCDNTDLSLNDLGSSDNDSWYYATFDNYTSDSYSGFSLFYNVDTLVSAATDTFTGTLTGNVYTYSGTAYADYHNLVVATLRSRGLSTYNSTNHGPVYQISATTGLTLVCTGAYSDISSNPFSTFLLSGITKDSTTFSYEVSLEPTDSKYITKVLGVGNFDKDRTQIPVFVEEDTPNLLRFIYNNNFVRGLDCNLVSLPYARSLSSQSIGWYLEKYTTPETPFLVSELRGNEVFKLFKFISISDGNAANTEIKVSIANISFDYSTFDVLVRAFGDTDSNPTVIEKFSNCNMDMNSNNFVAKKIGTSNGDYSLNSKYIMVEMADEFPEDALPCGFEGYIQRIYGSTSNVSPKPLYKVKYDFPGETIYDPPFGTTAGGSNSVTSQGDNVRRTYLGFSSKLGIDSSFLQYKGKRNITNAPEFGTAVESTPWNYLTKGFHLDSGATSIVISSSFVTSGEPAFDAGVSSFNQEPTDSNSPYYYLYSRKFTLCFAGGFDGWDIYRESRTNRDNFKIGGSGYQSGAASSPRYPNSTGQGMFKEIVVNQNTVDYANTDYYAYLLGFQTFANPEATNINVFATPGVDYLNHRSVVEEAINIIQFDRADSVYIVTTPDYQMFVPDANNTDDRILPQDAVQNLSDTEIDSNYTATYYPWILVRDTVSNTQIYIPPTGEVCRNLALTDNVSFPWFASAGYTRGIVNSVKARIKLTQDDRDTLYQGRINPIATFSDVGTVIWGNKTLQVADSALNRLNVRRLLLQARKLISAVAVRLLFEQNDQIVRQQFLDSVNPILEGIRRDRGLFDFRVTVSSSVEDLDRNTLSGKIYLKPTRALEFINIEFLITPTGASFENI